MDFERYKILLTVIDTGSISGAAERLGYTASGISRMMGTLEEETGFPLLHRGKKGVSPTKECMELLPSIRDFIFAGEKISQMAAKIQGGETGTIVIGTAYSHFYKWITKVTSEFHEQHPGVQFRIIYGTSTELIEKMQKYQADFCLVSRREGIDNWITICNDYMVAMLPAGHPLARQKSVPVEAGLGISMNNQINSHLWNGSVKHLPLQPNQPVEIGLAYQKKITPAAELFLNEIKDRLPQEL